MSTKYIIHYNMCKITLFIFSLIYSSSCHLHLNNNASFFVCLCQTYWVMVGSWSWLAPLFLSLSIAKNAAGTIIEVYSASHCFFPLPHLSVRSQAQTAPSLTYIITIICFPDSALFHLLPHPPECIFFTAVRVNLSHTTSDGAAPLYNTELTKEEKGLIRLSTVLYFQMLLKSSSEMPSLLPTQGFCSC